MNQRTSDAVEILKHRIRNKPEMQRMVDEAELLCWVAQAVYDARIEAGLSQEELAKRAGASLDEIEQIEDSDFEGPLLETAQRIAKALGRRIEIRLVPEKAPMSVAKV